MSKSTIASELDSVREEAMERGGESEISAKSELSALVSRPNLLKQEVRILASQSIVTSVSAKSALGMDSARVSRNLRISGSQDNPLTLTIGRNESIYNAAALAVDWMEHLNSAVVLAAEQMVPLYSAAALAAERMVPLYSAAALAARRMEPVLEAVELFAGQLEPAINSLAMATTAQKGSALSDRAIANANAMAETTQELLVSKYEALDAPLALPSVSGTPYIDSKDRSAVSDQRLWIRPRASVVHEKGTLEWRLANIDPNLPNVLWGARLALSTPNPDRPRHVIVSLRELVRHVLHFLAPTDSIRNWKTDTDYYDAKGQPTRRARLRFIYRNINSGALSKSVAAHEVWALSLMDAFQPETHVISSRLSDQELRVLAADVELLLQSLLEKSLLCQTRATKTM